MCPCATFCVKIAEKCECLNTMMWIRGVVYLGCVWGGIDAVVRGTDREPRVYFAGLRVAGLPSTKTLRVSSCFWGRSGCCLWGACRCLGLVWVDVWPARLTLAACCGPECSTSSRTSRSHWSPAHLLRRCLIAAPCSSTASCSYGVARDELRMKSVLCIARPCHRRRRTVSTSTRTCTIVRYPDLMCGAWDGEEHSGR